MGDIGMLKGGLLAWKLCCKGRSVVVDVVEHKGISIGLGGYRREEREEGEAYKSNRNHDMAVIYARSGLMQYYTLHTKREHIRRGFSGVWLFPDR